MNSFRKKFLSVENEIAVRPDLLHERAAAEPEPTTPPDDFQDAKSSL